MNNDHLEQGKQLFYKAYYKEALEEFKQISNNIIPDTEQTDKYFWMGRCAINLKDYKKAIHYFKSSTMYEEYNLYKAFLGLAYYKNEQMGEAYDIWDKILILLPETADDYFGRGLVKYNRNDYNGAIEDYIQAIKINPEYTEVYYNLGLIKCNKKDYNGAIEDYTQAIKMNSEYTEVYIERGLAKFNKKDYNDAVEDYTQAIKINPKNSKPYVLRGFMKYNKKDYNGAIIDAEKALEIDPHLLEAKNLKNLAQAKNSQEEFELSKQKYDTLADDIIKSHKEFKLSKQEYDALADKMKKMDDEFKIRQGEFKNHQEKYEKNIENLIQKVEDLNKRSEVFLKDVTAQGLSEAYDKQAKEKYDDFVKLRKIEAGTYIFIFLAVLLLYICNYFNNLFDYKNIPEMIFGLFVKIGIFIPVYFLVRLMNQTANHFLQRSELAGDTASQWSFYHKMELELKELKDTAPYTELYKNFMEQNIALRQKTNFELLEEIMAKRHHKTPSLKEIDALADTAKKIKDVCMPSATTEVK